MLEQLVIKNYALIEDLRISFSEGLNILTGETGAGKSIIIDALNLVLGERGSTSSIRKGSDTCTTSAQFDVSHNETLSLILQEQGIEVEEGSLLLTRQISSNGKNKCFANGQLITMKILNNIGSYLIDLHGQHSHQAILNSVQQMYILDDFGALNTLRNDVSSAHDTFTKLSSEYQSLLREEKERSYKIDLYNFQIQEISEAGLQLDEDDNIEKDITRLENAEKIHSLAEASYDNLYREEGSVLEKLGKIEHNIQMLSEIDTDVSKVLQTFQTSLYNLEEIHTYLRDYIEKIEFDSQKLDALIQRRELIAKLKQKYGITIQDILNYQKDAQKKYDELINIEENKNALLDSIEQSKEKLRNAADVLSKKRKKVSTELEKRIQSEIRHLGLPSITFRIKLIQELDMDGNEKISSHGNESVEFLISPNIGEDINPLARIASGGEMSRIMLGIKTVLAENDKIPTLVFDEVDTGIGGDMAQIVGSRLLDVSRSHQVISITHWPQIAGFGQTHYKVEKMVKNNRTNTFITLLKDKDRVSEISRMLGGSETAALSLKHATQIIKDKTFVEQKRP